MSHPKKLFVVYVVSRPASKHFLNQTMTVTLTPGQFDAGSTGGSLCHHLGSTQNWQGMELDTPELISENISRIISMSQNFVSYIYIVFRCIPHMSSKKDARVDTMFNPSVWWDGIMLRTPSMILGLLCKELRSCFAMVPNIFLKASWSG